MKFWASIQLLTEWAWRLQQRQPSIASQPIVVANSKLATSQPAPAWRRNFSWHAYEHGSPASSEKPAEPEDVASFSSNQQPSSEQQLQRAASPAAWPAIQIQPATSVAQPEKTGQTNGEQPRGQRTATAIRSSSPSNDNYSEPDSLQASSKTNSYAMAASSSSS